MTRGHAHTKDTQKFKNEFTSEKLPSLKESSLPTYLFFRSFSVKLQGVVLGSSISVSGRNVLDREVAKDGETANMPRPAVVEAWGEHHKTIYGYIWLVRRKW